MPLLLANAHAHQQRLADGVAASMRPTFALRIADAAVCQLMATSPFQIAERDQHDPDPALDRLEIFEAVLAHSQRALEFFEEQLDLPTKAVKYTHLASRQVVCISWWCWDV